MTRQAQEFSYPDQRNTPAAISDGFDGAQLTAQESVSQTIWEAAIPAAREYLDRREQGFPPRQEDCVSILGVGISNLSEPATLSLLEQALSATDQQARALYYVNAHTLNLACEDSHYRHVLNQAWRVFGDGTGVRWGARAQGITMRENLNGTDLVPRLLTATADRGYTYYLLGADEATNARAADFARQRFPGWCLLGQHHGYVQGDQAWPVIERINRLQPHLLLVGMGNPLQERWIHRHIDQLQVKLAMGIGGLFDHWGGNLNRAPRWVRSLGYEWLQILLQQPHKWRRYLVGNPRFLGRIWRQIKQDRQQTQTWAVQRQTLPAESSPVQQVFVFPQ